MARPTRSTDACGPARSQIPQLLNGTNGRRPVVHSEHTPDLRTSLTVLSAISHEAGARPRWERRCSVRHVCLWRQSTMALLLIAGIGGVLLGEAREARRSPVATV